jgi:hypothetical protein
MLFIAPSHEKARRGESRSAGRLSATSGQI